MPRKSTPVRPDPIVVSNLTAKLDAMLDKPPMFDDPLAFMNWLLFEYRTYAAVSNHSPTHVQEVIATSEATIEYFTTENNLSKQLIGLMKDSADQTGS